MQQWVDEYERMPETSISICLIPKPDAKHEFHIFCDASGTAIAAKIYIRSSSAEEKPTQYVSKATVAPIKTTTISKLELEAAAMEQNLLPLFEAKRQYTDKIQFWTDSMATLGSIKSTKHQKVFVANRIAKILANSTSEQLIFVRGKLNPADHGTRRLFSTDLKEKWLSAPKFHQNFS